MKKMLFVVLMLVSFASIAQNRVVGIVNHSMYPIIAVFGSNVNRNDWEENILNGDVIYSGQTRYINFYDGTNHCFFDFKAVVSTGQYVVRESVNVCSISYWHIY